MYRERRRVLAIALLALVVLAGCQTPVGSSDAQDGSSTTIDTTTSSPAEPANPWSKATLTVAVSADLKDRNYTALAAPAIEYWNENRETMATSAYGYPPRLELTSGTESADVLLQYTPTIGRCEGKSATRAAGFYHCSPPVDANTSIDGQLEIAVSSQFTNQTTTDATINALAGLYGIDSEDEPRRVEDPELLDPFPRADTVTVGITYIANDDRNITRLVQTTVDYWMENDDQYGDYHTNWVVDPDAPNPDVVVLYVDTIVQCGFGPNHEYYIGCTNLLTTERSANTPVHVEIAAGYDDPSTINTIKHEWGHLYGLEHGEEPMPLMSATGDAVPLNETNSTE